MQIPEEQFRLFDFPPPSKRKEYFEQLRHPFWTENKAKLIAKYLYYFVLVTKHGAYIDGFAGPQKPGKPGTWAARLVIESEPRWLRRFYLFEKEQSQYEYLEKLKESQPPDPKRKIYVYQGDFNSVVHDFLRKKPIGEHEATFCLL